MNKRENELAVCWLDGGIGAVIAATALVSTVAEKYKKVVVCASHPDVFINNEKVYDLYSLEDGNVVYAKYLDMKNTPVFKNQYMHYRPSITGEHICSLQHKFNGIEWDGRYPELHPEMSLVERFRSVFTAPKNAIIHINGSTGTFNPQEKWNFNKEVNRQHWDAIISILHENNINVIQVGLKTEAPLDGVHNLLGKTSIADTIALVGAVDYVFTIESCVQHMAGALGKPGAVFYGPTSPEAFGYKTLTPIEPTSDCKYCGRPDTHYGDIIKMNGQIIPWRCRTKECIKSISLHKVRETVTYIVNK
jgi:hypothetical protein